MAQPWWGWGGGGVGGRGVGGGGRGEGWGEGQKGGGFGGPGGPPKPPREGYPRHPPLIKDISNLEPPLKLKREYGHVPAKKAIFDPLFGGVPKWPFLAIFGHFWPFLGFLAILAQNPQNWPFSPKKGRLRLEKTHPGAHALFLAGAPSSRYKHNTSKKHENEIM